MTLRYKQFYFLVNNEIRHILQPGQGLSIMRSRSYGGEGVVKDFETTAIKRTKNSHDGETLSFVDDP